MLEFLTSIGSAPSSPLTKWRQGYYQFMDFSSNRWIYLIKTLVLLIGVLVFRWGLKRPVHRLFDWKYFRDDQEQNKKGKK